MRLSSLKNCFGHTNDSIQSSGQDIATPRIFCFAGSPPASRSAWAGVAQRGLPTRPSNGHDQLKSAFLTAYERPIPVFLRETPEKWAGSPM
jgi:hypothetical protein